MISAAECVALHNDRRYGAKALESNFTEDFMTPSTRTTTVASVLRPWLEKLFRGTVPMHMTMWDGSELGPDTDTTVQILVTINNPYGTIDEDSTGPQNESPPD